MPANPSQLWFQSPIVSIGTFRCGPDEPCWRRENHIGPAALIAFPRTAVRIRSPLGDVIATPNVAMLYNPNQLYDRELVSPCGDHCEWFAFDAAPLLDGPYAAALGIESAERPFAHGATVCESSVYLLQRALFRYASRAIGVDVLRVEELFLMLLARLLHRSAARRPADTSRERSRTRAFHRECVERIQRRLALRPGASVRLGELSDEVGLSPFHLCRIFKRETGLPIHRFISRIRLRWALEGVIEQKRDLSALALELGFASHSHFTDAFRREFGRPPTELRRADAASLLAEMSKISEAAHLRPRQNCR